MPTKNPRINVVLDQGLYESLAYLARKEGISLSLQARDLIKTALAMEEDIALSKIAEDRARTFSKEKEFTHDEVWSP